MNEWGISVERHDCSYRFLASSRSRKGHHMVDLLENSFNGSCSCEHFRFTCFSYYKVTRKPQNHGDSRTRCDHILACREFDENDNLRRRQELEQLPAKLSKEDLRAQAEEEVEPPF